MNGQLDMFAALGMEHTGKSEKNSTALMNGLDLSKFHDNGSRDALLEELGITKMNYFDVVRQLEQNGINVKVSRDMKIHYLRRDR